MSPNKRAAADDSDEELKVPSKAAKKSKHSTSADGKDDDGNPFWELSNKRRIGVSQFKNMCLVNIREYYDKDGKLLPGKKGISLSVEQYTAFLKAVPAINASLKKMGQNVDDVDDVSDAAAEPPKKTKSEKKKSSKANIDATSDEED